MDSFRALRYKVIIKMPNNTDPLDIIKRLDVKQNVTIRVIDEPTGKVVQEHIGHNAATNSLLTGIAHYLMGDGVLNQGSDTLSMWVPQYISLGTMGLTSQESEQIEVGENIFTVPYGIGYTPVAPDGATAEEKELNARLRFSEYLNQTPGFGADGYDENSNNNREWFGLGYPYAKRPANLTQYFGDAGASTYTLPTPVLDSSKDNIISITIYPDHDGQSGVINQDIHDTSVVRQVLSVNDYELDATGLEITITDGTSYTGRIAIIYAIDSKDAANCELINTNRSGITYRNIVPEIQSEIPNTLDVIFSAFVSVGALKDFRGDNDYIYITEAGLWSKPYYNESGDNGMLAGYRILPSDDIIPTVRSTKEFTGDGSTTTFLLDDTLGNELEDILSVKVNDVETAAYTFDKSAKTVTFMVAPEANTNIVIDFTMVNVVDTWKDMNVEANRQKVQRSIIRVGVNQVAQIIWKIQLGGLEQLNGLRYIYPPQYPKEVWEIV